MVAKQPRNSARGDSESAYDQLAEVMLEPGPLPRLLARVRSGSLDRMLIAGCDPAASRQLAARAGALTSRRYRSAIADGLEGMLRAAVESPSRRRVLPRREAVLANAPAMRALADVLRGASPLYAQGIALVNELLADGTGPLYVGDGEDLAALLREAGAAMVGHTSADASHRPSFDPSPGREHAIEGDSGQRPYGGAI
jgi:hypothetical protein